jgi:hypothetical protein
VTLIVAWRDPFCMVSDDLETPFFEKPRALSAPKKMTMLSQGLVLGLAGPGNELDKIVAGLQPFLPEQNWPRLEDATRAIVDGINDRIELIERMVTVVIAGTHGGERGIFDEGPRAVTRGGTDGLWLDRPWAFAGSGGMYAQVGREIASHWRPKVVGEGQLMMIAGVATDLDRDSAKPIWRIDLADGASEPYKWLE